MSITALARWLVIVALLVNAAGLVTPIVNAGDSVTYAALSQHIALNQDWVNLILDGQDWLDKPHFPFWLTALFFKLFGVSALTYNLPGFLFHVLGAYFTFRLARLFYSPEAAWLSVLVFVSAFQVMQTSTDVRAETYLTGSITGACYYWLRHDATPRLKFLILGAMFSAMAVMTKGIFTLITIGSGLLAMWFFQRRWHEMGRAKWWLALLLTLLFTGPELLALYLQFDAQAQKQVFGQTQVSGIRFFLWDSQFGRFFNTGPIRNTDGNPVFFLHVFLWAFLPWTGVAFAAVIRAWREFGASPAAQRTALVYLAASFLITFLLFSLTSFQLDYYAVILFPFAAIVCGQFLDQLLKDSGHHRPLYATQIVLSVLLLAMALGMALYTDKEVVLGALLLMLVLGLAGAQQLPQRSRVLLVFPLLGVALLYTSITLLVTLSYLSVGLAYNVDRALAAQTPGPIYVWRMPLVARELALYSPASCQLARASADLPPGGAPFYLVIRAAELAQIGETLAQAEPVAQGHWALEKTGLLPRMLRLAKGTEALEDVRVFRVKPGSR